MYELFSERNSDECYHLAGSSFVSCSLEDDLSIMIKNFIITHNILASILEIYPKYKLYFAGASEVFEEVDVFPRNEETAYNLRSVCGVSKLAS